MRRGREQTGALLLGAILCLARPASAADSNAIQQAVERGSGYLERLLERGKPYIEGGYATLAALTLIECGRASNTPLIQQTASRVREQAVTMTGTYELALAILLLDKLERPGDIPLIESLALRLLAGQTDEGGWSYQCPSISVDETQRLQTVIRNQQNPGKKPGTSGPQRRSVRDLPGEVRAQLQSISQDARPGGKGDNSNTQFAILALWVARRQGIPVDSALRLTERRFRTTQGSDGGWSYVPGEGPSTPSMTCAGLLGLALGHGGAAEAGGPNKPAAPELKGDPNVTAGLLALGTTAGSPAGNRLRVPILNPENGNGGGYYFLWSLERVAVAYELKTLGGHDWYAWGTEILLHNQRPDGSWHGDHGDGGADTCFGLLFLRKVNLIPDLTVLLKGRARDPDLRELTAGGVGGADFARKIGLKSAFTGNSQIGKTAPSGLGSETVRLAEELVNASADQRERVLARFRDGKGAVYTEALAAAIGKLDGTRKNQARDALADRLARMTPATLKEKLKEPAVEIRRAAALACAMKDDRSHIPDLIDLLQDNEPAVSRAAHAALKSLAGHDLGPSAQPWRVWWKQQGGR